MHWNVGYDKNLCDTNLCDQCLTHIIHINLTHKFVALWYVVTVYMYMYF